MVAEYDYDETAGTQTLARWFVDGPLYLDEHVMMHDATTGDDYFYLPQEFYSVAGLVDQDGELVEAHAYDAYGDVRIFDLTGPTPIELDFSAVGNPYYFTGRRRDPIHNPLALPVSYRPLYHYRARAYDPLHGRFLQRDPAEYVDGMNLYEYVRSTPTGLTDPTGRQAIDPQSITLLNEVLKGTRVEIHFERGAMHSHIARNTAREAYYIWRDNRFVRTSGVSHNNMIKRWLGNQYSTGRIQTAIHRGRQMLQQNARAAGQAGRAARAGRAGRFTRPGFATVSFLGWTLIIEGSIYVVQGSLELRSLAESNFAEDEFGANRQIAIARGVQAGEELAATLVAGLNFSCDCNGRTYFKVRPQKCIAEFMNVLANKVAFVTSLAYDAAHGRDPGVEYSFERGMNSAIRSLYGCVEDTCKKKLGQ